VVPCVAGQQDVRRRRVRNANKRRNVTFDVLSPVSGIWERRPKDEEATYTRHVNQEQRAVAEEIVRCLTGNLRAIQDELGDIVPSAERESDNASTDCVAPH
jgi:hypothetical protein